MAALTYPWFHNNQPLEAAQIPVVSLEEFTNAVRSDVLDGMRIASFFAAASGPHLVCLYAVIADENTGRLTVLSAAAQDSYPSMTPDCPQVHLFEREIAEQWGIVPQGHPWLKPVRFHPCYRSGKDVWRQKKNPSILPSVMNFYRLEGEQIHEVAVGPVHAGIIEPGHFRFQCLGEHVFHLEISLGYQHRGIERRLIGGPNPRTYALIQTAAGDTTIGHTTAYCQLLESMADIQAPPRAQAIRGIALELERLANHTGDLGALANDVGYLPTASFCGRIRGDFLNLTALLCGNRFGRNLVCPGGVRFDLTDEKMDQMRRRLRELKKDVTVAVELLWNTPSVLARFEETGKIDEQTCRQLGLVGVAARACGIETDVRFPAGVYQFAQVPVSTWHTGDVFARAYVRWLEIQRSLAFLLELLENCPGGPIRTEWTGAAPNRFCVSLTEGWRGEICHAAATDAHGRLAFYKITDPSFHNWTGLAMALRGQQISDFPLCNKSFNLSYCGHDL
ncbi:MAG TPA: NADH-quinone oxidoreductase subunit C [Anaerohalosphaeraceae bacterium]|mgnify:FL=1|nr:NADH-quinone oxidoreductase subunit C [Anaerohalosphaeraceae bacterium]HOL87628.1 NADH-quinone oxidoreductase subunit C [Anaerohalosphaeraceae bacterium]HPP55865.1 NADH-quinone oxidoreductase subunit C [Anaerohalosphaeraceae bacterium]